LNRIGSTPNAIGQSQANEAKPSQAQKRDEKQKAKAAKDKAPTPLGQALLLALGF
tara:strand:- start:562 stop:726 length:165 start_codon:yes stop_codon:yes gene_type:complete